jgi:hypothetical protein
MPQFAARSCARARDGERHLLEVALAAGGEHVDARADAARGDRHAVLHRVRQRAAGPRREQDGQDDRDRQDGREYAHEKPGECAAT